MLAEARLRGFIGPGSIEPHIDRAWDLVEALEDAPAVALDLGSGGGLPGLPLALAWPTSRWVLLDGSATRADFLRRAITELALSTRISVVAERAEVAGRGELRAAFDLVVARSFAGPAATAECGSPFLRPGGRLLVTEPPGGQPGRWDPGGLGLLGLEVEDRAAGQTAYQVLRQVSLCPDRFPRRVGVPAKRPLF